MACVRVRRGHVVLDYRDGGGRRRITSFGLAQDEKAHEDAQAALRRLAYLDEDTSRLYVKDALAMWLKEAQRTVDNSTWIRYEEMARIHLLPAFGGLRMGKLRRRRIKETLLEKMAERKKDGTPRYTRATVRTRMFGTLRTFLAWAVDEEIIPHSPCEGLSRRLFRRRPGDTLAGRAMTEAQMVRWSLEVERLPLLETRTALWMMLDHGLRIGECAGLRFDELDTASRKFAVVRQVRADPPVVWTPKTQRSVRELQLSARGGAHLDALLAERRADALTRGRPVSPWVFFPEGTPDRPASERFRYRCEKAMWRTCADAGLPRFTPHCLRHTYATLRLEHGESVKGLQRSLGHATLAQTDEYSRSASPAMTTPADLMAEILDRSRPQVARFAR